jgi:hypothetical protein
MNPRIPQLTYAGASESLFLFFEEWYYERAIGVATLNGRSLSLS